MYMCQFPCVAEIPSVCVCRNCQVFNVVRSEMWSGVHLFYEWMFCDITHSRNQRHNSHNKSIVTVDDEYPVSTSTDQHINHSPDIVVAIGDETYPGDLVPNYMTLHRDAHSSSLSY